MREALVGALCTALALLLLAAALWVASAILLPAQAQERLLQCGPRDRQAQVLREDYGEHAIIQGPSHEGQVMTLFASPETGTWTIGMTTPEGITCLLGSGGDLELLPLPKPGAGA